MATRGTGRIASVLVAAMAGAGLVAWALTTRLPEVEEAWEKVSSMVSSAAASAAQSIDPAPSSSARASPPADAAAPPPVHHQASPLSSAQLGAPLVHGAFVNSCGAPDAMKIVVDVTVKSGRASHVSVKTEPANPVVAACVERAVRDLQWDASPKTDHVTVTY